MRTVYKNSDHAFPLVARQVTGNVVAEVEGLDSVTARVSAEKASTVQALFVRMDAANAAAQLKFRAAYEVYKTNPCERDDYLRDEVRRIMDEEGEHRRMQTELLAIVQLAANADRETIESAIKSAEERLSVLPERQRRQAAFALADREMRQWSSA